MSKTLTATMLLLAAALPATADAEFDAADVLIAQAQGGIERMTIPADDRLARMPMGDGDASRVVKGAPYCAEAVHETVQWLPDGAGAAPNRIVRQTSTLLCRDGEGRTRQELQRGNRRVVYLRDPVARESWMLDPERKSAWRTDSRGTPDSAAWRDYAERMREWARGVAERARSGSHASQMGSMGSMPPQPPIAAVPAVPAAPPVPPAPPVPVVISRGEGTPRDVEVNVVRLRAEAAASAAADWPMAPPAVAWRASTWAPRGAGSVMPLGSRDIDGVRAHGERTTWTIEAGKVGNEKPIAITREVWTAPELMITLSSRDFDPRSGEINYRLKNIRRGEPDAALMRVPADFKQPQQRERGASAPRG